jgi:hypothetical protein
LYVPFGSGALYREANIWKLFNVVELPDMSEGGVSVTPTAHSALIEWQSYEAAEGYKLLIYGDEAHTDLISTLEFDAAGVLVNTTIHRAKSAVQPAAASDNIICTVENLLSGSTYYYTLETIGAGGTVLATKSGSFTTTGDIPNNVEPLPATPIQVAGYYSIPGAKLPKEPASGLYIILYDNGKAEKAVK